MSEASFAPLRLGLLGARSWIANQAVIPAVQAADGVELVAVAAAGGEVPDHLGHLDVGSYHAVLADPRVEAVYLPLPNGLHRAWAEQAAAAGKHVLCEKPLGVDEADARAIAGACDASGVLLAEAWMTPFGNRWAEAVRRASSGDLDAVRHVRGQFTFTLGPGMAGNYRWDPTQGGGALLDVGIYALGAAVALWGPDPRSVAASRHLGPSGVDATTSVWCEWGDGRSASALVSFELPESQRLELIGTGGHLIVDTPAYTGGPTATAYVVERPDGTTESHSSVGDDPYRGMVEAFARWVRGVAPWPRPVTEAVALARLLDRVLVASA